MHIDTLHLRHRLQEAISPNHLHRDRVSLVLSYPIQTQDRMMDFHRDDIYCTAYTTRPKISFHQAPPTPDSNIQKFQGSHRAVTMRSHRMDEVVMESALAQDQEQVLVEVLELGLATALEQAPVFV